MRTPETSGSTSPAVSPKEWKTGSTLNTLSVRPKSMRAAACAAFASMLRWESTTPFGVPSEPEVKRIAAGSSGLRGPAASSTDSRPRSLSSQPDLRPHVFEVDDLQSLGELRDETAELALLDEGRGGDDGVDLRRLAGGEDVGRAGGEIDHRGDAAGRHQREERDGRAVGVGQHHADRFAFARRAASACGRGSRRRGAGACR